MKNLFFAFLIVLSGVALADVPADQIPVREANAIAADQEIKDLVATLSKSRNLVCPSYTNSDVVIGQPKTNARFSPSDFSLRLSCKALFGAPDSVLQFSGQVMWIGGDLDFARVNLNSITIN